MNRIPGPARALALCALLLLLAGCFARRAHIEPAAPRSHEEGAALINEIRAFERRIGFKETGNFLRFSEETKEFPFCGHVSRFYLPYSYEDPAIRWLDTASEAECRKADANADVSFGQSEALGESETPVTRSMLAAPLERFLYLVLHEDCHEQFELPHGIEEALCNVIAYEAMAVFSEEKFGPVPRENQAVQRFAREGSRHAHLAVAHYERLAALYARHDRSRITSFALLRERTRIFARAERDLDWPKGAMNNVWIANTMTYSRHYALVERVFEALGRDLVRTMAFFRSVDALKPSSAEVMARHGLKTATGLEFVRAYEAAIVETIRKKSELLRKNPPTTSTKPRGLSSAFLLRQITARSAHVESQVLYR